MKENLDKTIQEMTVEEKAGLCSGADFWHTKAVEREGVPQVVFSDGPYGVRKVVPSADGSGDETVKAVCMPAGCAGAASFDRDVMNRLGKTLGRECRAENVDVILGPAVNIKRSPLGGRNFEYLSEDPYLTGELGAAYVKGVQSTGTGTSVKHFAANSQETQRVFASSNVDERTLREIYLAAFEKIVKQAKPWTIMCSYNRLNGIFASENSWLLTDVLRKEWGYDGAVISDWGAVSDRVKGLAAGLDIEMPGSKPENDQRIAAAVRDGSLDPAVLDRAAERVLQLVQKAQQGRAQYLAENARNITAAKDAESEASKAVTAAQDVESGAQNIIKAQEADTAVKAAQTDTGRDSILKMLKEDHKTAVELAEQCMVLLKNEEDVLPLRKKEKVLFVGGFAEDVRYQGGGSSHVNAYKVNSVTQLLEKDYPNADYIRGFEAQDTIRDKKMFRKTLKKAEKADKVVVFAGLPEVMESEGYDRQDLSLPNVQNDLIRKLTEAGHRVIVVLSNGSPVVMPWAGKVRGILEAYLAGEGFAEAVLDILYGKACPCGHLPETFPLRLEDTPCYLTYPGKNYKSDYSEGVFVGYRYYDKRRMEVLFPFGHGLSYTKFSLSNMCVSDDHMTPDTGITVSVDVTNIGRMAGKEVLQLYISDETGAETRPVSELKGFGSVMLQPGETGTITFSLDFRSFAFWDTASHAWRADNGSYRLLIGESSRDIRMWKTVYMTGSKEYMPPIDRNILIGDLFRKPQLRRIFQERMQKEYDSFVSQDPALETMQSRMMKEMPLRMFADMLHIPDERIDSLIEELKSAPEEPSETSAQLHEKAEMEAYSEKGRIKAAKKKKKKHAEEDGKKKHGEEDEKKKHGEEDEKKKSE